MLSSATLIGAARRSRYGHELQGIPIGRLPQVLRRGLAELLPETAREIIQAAEAHCLGHFPHVALVIAQQVSRSFQAQQPNKLVGCKARQGGELAVQLGPAQADLPAERFHIKVGIVHLGLDHPQGLLQEPLVEGGDGDGLRLHQHLAGVPLPQLFPLGNQVGDAGPQFLQLEGLGQVIVGPQVQAREFAGRVGFGRQQDDGDVTGALIAFQALTEAQPVQAGHHHVGNNQVGNTLQGQIQALKPVGGLQDGEAFGQIAADELAQVGVVLHHQHPPRMAGGEFGEGLVTGLQIGFFFLLPGRGCLLDGR